MRIFIESSYNIFAVVSILIVNLSVGASVGLAASTSENQYYGLSALESWDQVSAEARARKSPIVLLVEQRNCDFCQRAKAERLRPASLSLEFADRVIFISVATDLDELPIEHNGAKISTLEFAETYDASLTPTVMFLDYRGSEVQKRMVGYTAGDSESADFRTRLSSAINVVSTSR